MKVVRDQVYSDHLISLHQADGARHGRTGGRQWLPPYLGAPALFELAERPPAAAYKAANLISGGSSRVNTGAAGRAGRQGRAGGAVLG